MARRREAEAAYKDWSRGDGYWEAGELWTDARGPDSGVAIGGPAGMTAVRSLLLSWFKMATPRHPARGAVG